MEIFVRRFSMTDERERDKGGERERERGFLDLCKKSRKGGNEMVGEGRDI